MSLLDIWEGWAHLAYEEAGLIGNMRRMAHWKYEKNGLVGHMRRLVFRHHLHMTSRFSNSAWMWKTQREPRAGIRQQITRIYHFLIRSQRHPPILLGHHISKAFGHWGGMSNFYPCPLPFLDNLHVSKWSAADLIWLGLHQSRKFGTIKSCHYSWWN